MLQQTHTHTMTYTYAKLATAPQSTGECRHRAITLCTFNNLTVGTHKPSLFWQDTGRQRSG